MLEHVPEPGRPAGRLRRFAESGQPVDLGLDGLGRDPRLGKHRKGHQRHLPKLQLLQKASALVVLAGLDALHVHADRPVDDDAEPPVILSERVRE